MSLRTSTGTAATIKAVKFVEMPASVMLDAVVQGRVDTAHVTDPAFSDAIASKRIRVLTNPLSTIARRFLLTAFFTTSDWLVANKRTAQVFAGGRQRRRHWAMNNRAQAAQMLAKYIPMKEPRVTSTFGDKLDPALVQPMYDLALNTAFFRARSTAERCSGMENSTRMINLAATGPQTLTGRYLRRFWMPIAVLDDVAPRGSLHRAAR